MKISLRVIGLIGLVLFAALFGLTYGVPQQVEESAKGFIKSQIEKEVRGKAALVTDSSLAQKAKSLADKLGYQESQLKKDIENDLPGKIASIMASMCGYDCEKKKQLAEEIKGGYLTKIKNLQVAQVNLTELVKGKYVEIVSNLKMDLRIFTLSNASMFLLLLLLSILKPQAIKQLYVPGIMLFTATLISSSIYVFGQDWFYTIIYNDYMGLAYLVYIGIIFAFLLDIAINKCRITCIILDMLGSVFSGIGEVTHC